MLFCMQTTLALAHCTRLQAGSGSADAPFLLVLCPAQGLTTINMSSPPDDEEAPHQAQVDWCLACHALPSVVFPAPSDLTTPLPLAADVSFGARHARPAVQPRAPPYRPTGPPDFVKT